MHIKEKWECMNCNEVHDYEDEAYDCCRPIIRMIYACPICEDVHNDRSDAVDCCKDSNGAPIEYRPTALDLEAMGQERLF